MFHQMVNRLGLAEMINRSVNLFKIYLPYSESDHVLNIAYNIVAGGTCLDHLELRRNDEVYLDALGVQRILDPTTAGDFYRRFTPWSALLLPVSSTPSKQLPRQWLCARRACTIGTRSLPRRRCRVVMTPRSLSSKQKLNNCAENSSTNGYLPFRTVGREHRLHVTSGKIVGKPARPILCVSRQFSGANN
jgi:hypothetical protein